MTASCVLMLYLVVDCECSMKPKCVGARKKTQLAMVLQLLADSDRRRRGRSKKLGFSVRYSQVPSRGSEAGVSTGQRQAGCGFNGDGRQVQALCGPERRQVPAA